MLKKAFITYVYRLCITSSELRLFLLFFSYQYFKINNSNTHVNCILENVSQKIFYKNNSKKNHLALSYTNQCKNWYIVVKKMNGLEFRVLLFSSSFKNYPIFTLKVPNLKSIHYTRNEDIYLHIVSLLYTIKY